MNNPVQCASYRFAVWQGGALDRSVAPARRQVPLREFTVNQCGECRCNTHKKTSRVCLIVAYACCESDPLSLWLCEVDSGQGPENWYQFYFYVSVQLFYTVTNKHTTISQTYHTATCFDMKHVHSSTQTQARYIPVQHDGSMYIQTIYTAITQTDFVRTVTTK